MLLNRQRLTPFIAELLGTFSLTLAILAVGKSEIPIPYFVSIGAGLALAVLVLVLGSLSGGHFNPAVTFGMWTARKIKTLKAIVYIAGQFMGAVLAWKLFTFLRGEAITNLATTSFNKYIFIAEIVGASLFTLGVASAVYQKYEGGKLASTIGGSLTLGIMVASILPKSALESLAEPSVSPLVGILNPAVALGSQAWSIEYIAGPLIGALIGVNIYALVFAGEKLNIMPSSVSLPARLKTVSSNSGKTKSTGKTKKKPVKSTRKKKK